MERKKDAKCIQPFKKMSGSGVAQSDLEKSVEFNSQFTDVFNKNELSQVPILDRLFLSWAIHVFAFPRKK